MPLARFAEEDGFDAAAGFESFPDEAEAFNANAAGIGLQAAAESDAELLKPAIVAAGEEGIGRGRSRIVAAGFGRGGHVTAA